ncbi:MAG: cytochrome c [Acidobacteriota bacterium]|nr:cytochrome c [Acidobacteriota bacterium]
MKRIFSFSLLAGFIALAVFFAPRAGKATGAMAAVTFSKDVAPIIQKNCVVCHRPGEVAPMAFTSYKEVRPWARSIREKVVTREMPPWFADPKHGEFSNDCRLSQKEIDTIAAWVEGGAAEGDSKLMPPNPKFTEGWQIAKPDVVLSMTDEFHIPAEGVIPYKYFAIPTNFTEDKYVQFAELRAGDRQHVHHVIASVRYPSSAPLPPAGEIKPEALAAARQQQQNAEDSDGRLIGWAPGEAPLILHSGQAKLVKKGSVLIFQVHYTTNGAAGKDRTSIGLIFSRAPVEKRVITAGAVGRNLVIPPGDPNYESTASFAFKEDSHIDSLHPHMHVRGKDFLYRLVYADGTSKILLSVPRYDFAWQLTYFLKQPVAAPKGSRLEVVAHHDNSPKNKFNPDPTATVRWGDQTWDEMMIGYLDYTIDKQDLRRASSQAASNSGQ